MHVLAGCNPSDRTEDNYSAGGRKDEPSVSQPETGSCSSQVDALPWFLFFLSLSSPLLSAELTFAIRAKEEIKFGKEEVLSFIRMKGSYDTVWIQWRFCRVMSQLWTGGGLKPVKEPVAYDQLL